jgi:hypothetical protein
MSSRKPAVAPAEPGFTADDLNQLIAQRRRLNAAEKNVAAIVEEAAAESSPGHGRLPLGAQGPHSPTD